MSRVTVLGATGGLGRAITLELASRGHHVTAVSRSGPGGMPAGIRSAAADLTDRQQAVSACAGAHVVVMAANTPYGQRETLLPTLVDHALAAAATAGARLVMVDNLYAYGSPGVPITEATPEAPPLHHGPVRLRARLRPDRHHPHAEAVARTVAYFRAGDASP